MGAEEVEKDLNGGDKNMSVFEKENIEIVDDGHGE